MSFGALGWACKCDPGSSSRKLVLFALADRHNSEVDGAYPSISWIADFTNLNRKTVIVCLDDLERFGFITDTGERRGDTRQIKLYHLHLETVPKVEQSQKRNSTEKVAKQSQKRDTDTIRTGLSQKAKPSSIKPARKSKTSIPENFMPVLSGKTASVVAGWPPGRFDDELEHFRDHHTAKGTLSFDWQASFRTWVKNSTKWEPRNGHQRQPVTLRGTRPDPALDMLRQGQAELAEWRNQDADRPAWPALPAIGPG